jgi:nicotinamide-nucleotide amidase
LSSGSSPPFEAPALAALAACRAAGTMLTTAESCTGGMVAAALTAIAGASDVFERGFVTYSNAAKTELLGVPRAFLDRHGAVSAEVAEAMAAGALARSAAGLALAVTGIAGPGGATPAKPVGLVYFGLARRGRPAESERRVFSGDRAAIRAAATLRALDWIADAAGRP